LSSEMAFAAATRHAQAYFRFSAFAADYFDIDADARAQRSAHGASFC